MDIVLKLYIVTCFFIFTLLSTTNKPWKHIREETYAIKKEIPYSPFILCKKTNVDSINHSKIVLIWFKEAVKQYTILLQIIIFAYIPHYLKATNWKTLLQMFHSETVLIADSYDFTNIPFTLICSIPRVHRQNQHNYK